MNLQRGGVHGSGGARKCIFAGLGVLGWATRAPTLLFDGQVEACARFGSFSGSFGTIEVCVLSVGCDTGADRLRSRDLLASYGELLLADHLLRDGVGLHLARHVKLQGSWRVRRGQALEALGGRGPNRQAAAVCLHHALS